MEPTSEQELKSLLEEGKITEEEYNQLLGVIRQKKKLSSEADAAPQRKSRSGFGKAALILMLAGILVPVAFAALAAVSGGGFKLGAILVGLLCFPCEVLAFILGIIGWKSPAGKTAAIGVPAMGVVLIMISLILPVLAYTAAAVPRQAPGAEVQSFISHKAYPLDSLEGVLTQNNVEMDTTVSFDGKGSLKVRSDTLQKTVIRLFETGPMNVENRMLIYQATIQSDLSQGKAYLEMWCDIPGKGEFFSRGLEQPITGITQWTTAQTPFRLEAGQMPANIKLNVVVEGTGTIWIDDVKLLSGVLN